MRGKGQRGIIAENLTALYGLMEHKQKTKHALRMCWRCQKDKPTMGGHIKTFTGGTMKFICKACMDEKQAASNVRSEQP